jgi:hypothetical protein
MGFPLVIYSTPGTGKTSKGKGLSTNPELAELMGYRPGTTIPTALIPAQQAESEDINGFAFLRKKGDDNENAEVGFARPSFYCDDPMILIFDEVNRAKEPVKSALFPLLTGDEMINGFRLHPRSLVVLLGNPLGQHAGVRELDNAIKGRMSHYDFRPVTEDWIKAYAKPHGVDGRVVAYLERNPDDLCRYEPMSRSDAQPSPRTWTKVGEALSSHRRDIAARRRAVLATIGRAVGEPFLEYAERFEILPGPTRLATQPESVAIPQELDGLMLLVGSLGQHLSQPQTETTVPVARGAAKVLARFAAAGYIEQTVLAVRQALNRFLARGGVQGVPACLMDAEVQATLAAQKDVQEFLIAVGKAQMGEVKL